MKRTQLLALLFCTLITACGNPHADTAKREADSRLTKAEAMFQERCKKSGEFIHRTAENVEGILLMKIREQNSSGDQYKLDDPYGHDSTGDQYIKSFLFGRGVGGFLTKAETPVKFGYRYVEALDPQDGKRYRYTGSVKEVTRISSPLIGGDGKSFSTRDFVLDKTPSPGPAPRYGVTYDDISTREEREYWIAGSSLKVIDLKTNEVMAERIGYMMDRGQGANGGGRSPWLHAADNACPSFPLDGSRHSDQVVQARNFTEKTLKPIQRN